MQVNRHVFQERGKGLLDNSHTLDKLTLSEQLKKKKAPLPKIPRVPVNRQSGTTSCAKLDEIRSNSKIGKKGFSYLKGVSPLLKKPSSMEDACSPQELKNGALSALCPISASPSTAAFISRTGSNNSVSSGEPENQERLVFPKYKTKAPGKIGVPSDQITEWVPTKGSTADKFPSESAAKKKTQGACDLNWSFLSASSEEHPKEETPAGKDEWNDAKDRFTPNEQEKKVECEISWSMVSLTSLLESKRESQEEKHQNEWA